MNELLSETSPYLLQHASNPVFWKAWNENSLQKAKTENKLILVSSGYAACHWCHVMEHECFENEEVATIMNQNYISIKVDREERPDVDALYMKALQLITNQGGWPLNVICLPDGRPIWGATYLPKQKWINALQQIQKIFETNLERLNEQAERVLQGIKAENLYFQELSKAPKIDLEKIVKNWSENFDLEFGGINRVPKFMMPTNLLFLQQYGHIYNQKKILEYVDVTLTRMAWGGVFDVLGGGFSRYSVDAKWHIPHFEKMLYDNAQLLSVYAEAYKRSQNQLYKDVIEKTICFIENDWLSPENGFYSSFDADSLTSNNILEEGAFYVWTKEELQKIPNDDFELFSTVFNINNFGFWEHNHYVLIQNKPLFEIAKQHSIAEIELIEKKKQWEALLYNERLTRTKPRLDDKIITSWNALTISGLVDAYQALNHPNYLDIALKNAHFIINNLWNDELGLFHTYKNKNATITGFLDDYALVIEAFIKLFETTTDEFWLRFAKQLTDFVFDNFYDETIQFFRYNNLKNNTLVAEYFEVEDNVIPASNSVMAHNLFRLSIYFYNDYYQKISQLMLTKVGSKITHATAFSNWLRLELYQSKSFKEVAICGKNANYFLSETYKKFNPNSLLCATEKPVNIPFLNDRCPENTTLFYICENKSCQQPLSSFEQFKIKISNSKF